MSTEQPANDERLPMVKSREVQRAIFAEMAGDSSRAARHFLAAAHLELVLAEDYAAAGADDRALRSRISAASCFWRAGEITRSRSEFDTLSHAYPASGAEIQRIIAELERDYSAKAS